MAQVKTQSLEGKRTQHRSWRKSWGYTYWRKLFMLSTCQCRSRSGPSKAARCSIFGGIPGPANKKRPLHAPVHLILLSIPHDPALCHKPIFRGTGLLSCSAINWTGSTGRAMFLGSTFGVAWMPVHWKVCMHSDIKLVQCRTSEKLARRE